MPNEVKITIGADTKKADKAVKSFRQRLDGVAKRARVAGVAFSAMGGAGVIAIKSFAEAALVQQHAMNTLAVVMDNAGESFDSMEEKIMSTTAALQSKTNYGDEAQIRVLAQLVPMLGSTEDALAALPAVMDVAAVSNKDLESTVMTMGPVLAGLTDRIRGTTLEFDKSQGPMERIDHILASVGGTAEAQANPFIQLSNAVGDLKEKFGDHLLPTIKPVLGAFQSLFEKLQTLNPKILKIAAAVLLGVTAFALIVGPMLIIIGLLPLLAAGFVALNLSMGVVTLIILGIAAAIAAAILIFKNWNTIVEVVSKVWEVVSSEISDMFRSKWGWILPGGIFIKSIMFIHSKWETIWGAIRDIFSEVVRVIEQKLNYWVNVTIDAINDIIGAVNALGGWLGINIPTINNVVISLGDAFNSARDEAVRFAIKTKIAVSDALDSIFVKTEDLTDVLQGFDAQVDESTRSLEHLGKALNAVATPSDLFDEFFAESAERMGGLREEAQATADALRSLTSAFHVPSGGAPAVFEQITDPITGKPAMEVDPITGEETPRSGMRGVPTKDLGVVHPKYTSGAAHYLNTLRGLEDQLVTGKGTVAVGDAIMAFSRIFSNIDISEFASEKMFPSLSGIFAGRFGEFAQGGRVPGPEGSPQLAMVHGGEMILNRNQQGAGIVVNITGNHITGEMELDRLVRRAITSAGVRGAF
jgi:hypothetical protein